MDIEEVIELMKKIPGLNITGYTEMNEILFKSAGISEKSLANFLNEISKVDWQSKMILKENSIVYCIQGEDIESLYNSVKEFAEPQSDLGIPDLSLVTIHQMVKELKSRPGLTFVLTWVEDQDNMISVEGSGHPTMLVGLLSRANFLAAKWADKKPFA